MAQRRCTTPGCTGTLPPGTGKHCPRCGGTKFLRRRGRGVVIVMLVIAGLGIAGRQWREHSLPATATPDRHDLAQMYEVASKMTVVTARDDAYAGIARRAIGDRDFEYAYEVANDIAVATEKDAVLMEIVDQSLNAGQPGWADRSAKAMMITPNRDTALRHILERVQSKK